MWLWSQKIFIYLTQIGSDWRITVFFCLLLTCMSNVGAAQWDCETGERSKSICLYLFSLFWTPSQPASYETLHETSFCLHFVPRRQSLTSPSWWIHTGLEQAMIGHTVMFLYEYIHKWPDTVTMQAQVLVSLILHVLRQQLLWNISHSKLYNLYTWCSNTILFNAYKL